MFSQSPDFNSAVARFFSGDADLFEQLRPENIAKLAGDTVRRAVPYPSLQYAYLALNIDRPRASWAAAPHLRRPRRAPRAHHGGRSALRCCRTSSASIGIPSYGPFPRSLPVADTTLPQLPYDTLKARALLDSAGWTVGADGVRAKNGQRLEFTITTPASSATAQAVRRAASGGVQEGRCERQGGRRPTSPDSWRRARTVRSIRRSKATAPTRASPASSSRGARAALGKDGSNYHVVRRIRRSTRCSTARPSPSIRRARARTRVARSRSSSRTRRASGCTSRPRSPASTSASTPTNMRADGCWAGLADWWIPASERTPRDRIGLRPAP